MKRLPTLLLFLALVARGEPGPSPVNPVPKQGAELLKTDILGVFAHPDDETGIAATLAAYALGRGSVVANVYCTRGEGGANMVGTQSGASLGLLREAELRDCLRRIGVRYCYFLDQLDWAYTESLAATLRKWGKEETLRRLVRVVRVLRPEIILTMNPAPTPGQHGHHQAAGVLATEAFAAAADPHRYPEQLAQEGLEPWQARKLYYGGGRGGAGTTITTTNALPDGRTPADVAAEALANHRSQAFGNFANSPWLRRPQSFTLVKSFIPSLASETDLLRGMPVPASTLTAVNFAPSAPPPALSIQFVPRPAISRYREWARQQGIEHVSADFPADVPVLAGQRNDIQIELDNGGGQAAAGEIEWTWPAGWEVSSRTTSFQIGAGKKDRLTIRVTPPKDSRADADVVAAYPRSGLRAAARLHPIPHWKAPRLKAAPAMDGTGAGWENVRAQAISPADLVQGKVANEADSSARFRLGHDGTFLFVDVEVTDDVIVSNIAPNDIKGHWRSDSVEICLDPMPGAEDTMGCYKVGIFPFDSSGRVRGARDADAHQGLIEETAPGTRLAAKRTVSGYRVQATIPFKEIGISPRKLKRIGFNIIIYDGDKRDAAPGENINKSRIAWAPRSGVQGRPEDWGRIDLE